MLRSVAGGSEGASARQRVAARERGRHVVVAHRRRWGGRDGRAGPPRGRGLDARRDALRGVLLVELGRRRRERRQGGAGPGRRVRQRLAGGGGAGRGRVALRGRGSLGGALLGGPARPVVELGLLLVELLLGLPGEL